MRNFVLGIVLYLFRRRRHKRRNSQYLLRDDAETNRMNCKYVFRKKKNIQKFIHSRNEYGALTSTQTKKWQKKILLFAFCVSPELPMLALRLIYCDILCRQQNQRADSEQEKFTRDYDLFHSIRHSVNFDSRISHFIPSQIHSELRHMLHISAIADCRTLEVDNFVHIWIQSPLTKNEQSKVCAIRVKMAENQFETSMSHLMRWFLSLLLSFLPWQNSTWRRQRAKIWFNKNFNGKRTLKAWHTWRWRQRWWRRRQEWRCGDYGHYKLHLRTLAHNTCASTEYTFHCNSINSCHLSAKNGNAWPCLRAGWSHFAFRKSVCIHK